MCKEKIVGNINAQLFSTFLFIFFPVNIFVPEEQIGTIFSPNTSFLLIFEEGIFGSKNWEIEPKWQYP